MFSADVLSPTAIYLTWNPPLPPCNGNDVLYTLHYVSKSCGSNHIEPHTGASNEPFAQTAYKAEGLQEITDYQFTLTTIRLNRNVTVTIDAQTLRAGKSL